MIYSKIFYLLLAMGRQSPGYSVTVRLEIPNVVGNFARIAQVIASADGDIRDIQIVKVEKDKVIRDITINTKGEEHEKEIVRRLKKLGDIKVLRVVDRTFQIHEGGKISIQNKVSIINYEDLARVYTPGVARICKHLKEHPEDAYRYTIKGHTVAVITDGSAVLGLGNLGPIPSLPVMEGKCMLFKELANIDAFPLAIGTQIIETFVETVKYISPVFGGINLEDISAPRCFEIEKRLRQELDIPVVHDDQHGTAIVVLAGLINVERILKKRLKDLKIVISGAGASGIATAKLLLRHGAENIILCDTYGTIYRGRTENMNPYKSEIAELTNPENIKGSLSSAIKGADIFIGLSGPNILSLDDLLSMNKDRVVFALANPDPEIDPTLAMPHVRILATGRSDYPNQINNALAFPGLFKGLLEAKAKKIDEDIFLESAKALAHVIKDEELNEEYIIPSVFDRRVVSAISKAIIEYIRKKPDLRKL